MGKRLREMIERAETWPEEAQEEAVALLRAIEAEFSEPYELTDDDRRAIDQGLEDVRQGRFASDEEVSWLFARFRHP
jgi:predicted transcriptional regulator